MKTTNWREKMCSTMLASAVLACGWAGQTALGEEDQPVAQPRVKVLVQGVQVKEGKPLVVDVEHEVEEDGYWIGLAMEPVSETLQVQLDLPQGTGLVVSDVAPKSPAEQAGLQKHDVLVGVGDKPLKSHDALGEAVQNSQGKPLSLSFLRAGKKQTVQVTPNKREPQDKLHFKGFAIDKLPDEWRKQMETWMKEEQDRAAGPMRLRLYGPGAVQAFHGKLNAAELPEDVSVVITQTGKGPAKIAVKQNDKTWNVTSDELDKLPAELREPVSNMLNGPKGPFAFELPKQFPGNFPGTPPKAIKVQPGLPAQPGQPKTASGLDSMSDMKKEMTEMRKELEAMRKELQSRQDEREALHNALKKLLENK